MAHVLCILDTSAYRHTFRICVIDDISTATNPRLKFTTIYTFLLMSSVSITDSMYSAQFYVHISVHHKSIYESWNFNRGNYLFTTDTK